MILEAKRRGIESNRIIFSKNIDLKDHISRQRCADLVLDTFNFSSATMTCLALKSGLPILTLPGKTYSSRLTASILNSLGLEELISKNVDDYESKALEFALNKDKISDIKLKIDSLKLSSPYFNSNQYCLDLENIFKSLL